MIYTAVGLPNTCSRCGRACTRQWWAEHEDAARSGAGLCEECESTRPESTSVAPSVPVRYEPVGEALTRAQPSSAKLRGKIK
jgi:hypothetical protein